MMLLALLLCPAAEWHVAPGGRGDGSAGAPFGTIQAALERAEAGDRVMLAPGVYREHSLLLRESVQLLGRGGASVIDAERQGRILKAANGARIEGITFRGGFVRGPGGAILCSGTSPVIANNVFIENGTDTPATWNPKKIHEDANDGGAIACLEGCAAVIEGNVFDRNYTNTGRGGALAVVRARPDVNGNLFADNESGRQDLHRSSDGGAVSFYDRSRGRFRHNRLIRNRALAHNDGGGLFLALWSWPVVEDNVFADNYADDDGGAIFAGGQKHHYGTPLDPLPPAAEFNIVIRRNLLVANRNFSLTGGAFRITMETRGEFTGNTLAHNTGGQFQRSELLVKDNTILDAVFYTENKEGLAPPRFEGNVFRPPLRVEGGAKVVLGKNREGAVKVVDDGQEWIAYSSRAVAGRVARAFVTRRGDPTLRGRVARVGGEWGVITAVEANTLVIEGIRGESRQVWVLPSFRPVPAEGNQP